MSEGFFPGSALLSKQPLTLVPKCGSCGLYKLCKSPKMPPSGDGRRRVLIVGEAPGATEDDENRQFAGETGTKLKDTLADIDVDMREDCRLTNALICFTGDVRVQSPSRISKVYRRSYSGELLRVETSDGRVLSGTPNHPILTARGWVALGLLVEGDDLVCCSLRESTSPDNTDVKNRPPTFEKVFTAFSELGDFGRMIGRRDDFHGDGEDGDVDVITPNGLLRDRIKSFVNQHLAKVILKASNKTLAEFLSPGRAATNPLDFIGSPFASSNSGVSSRRNCHSSFAPSPSEPQTQSIALPTKNDPRSLECQSQSVVRDAERLRQWREGFPGLITTDRVVKVEWQRLNEPVSGNDASIRTCHVYNLETEHGYYLADDIIVSNCRPPGNETPTAEQIEYCRPNLIKEIESFDPEIIIPLGTPALQSVIGHVWKTEDIGGIMKWAGYRIPSRKPNAWICPTYHPSYVSRSEKNAAVEIHWKRHLKAAFALKGRPWDPVPDYTKQVERILDPEEARKKLVLMMAFASKRTPFSFDYETTTVKPETEGGLIVCCSISNGEQTISFPWYGTALINEVGGFLRGGIPKIGQNIKFEDRWTWKEFGFGVNNWVMDNMLHAHVEDCREGVTGMKFQAFAELGADAYDEEVKPFLQAEKGKRVNQILREVEIDKLLLYCGLDSLLEWTVGMRRLRSIGWKP